MFIASVSLPYGQGFFGGRMWKFDERVEEFSEGEGGTHGGQYFRQLFLPFGVDALGTRPSVGQYANRLYFVGGHSENLVVDEYDRVSRMGIAGPTSAPTITGATGTGYIGYLSFWDELTDEHSPLSDGTEISNVVPRTWTGLPDHEPGNYMVPLWGKVNFDAATSTVYPCADDGSPFVYGMDIKYLRPGDKLYNELNGACLAVLKYPAPTATGLVQNSHKAKLYNSGIFANVFAKPVQRVSHVCLWISNAGGLPRLVTKVRLGTASVTESVPYTAFGEAHLNNYQRFPYCTINTVYHDRLIMAGDQDSLNTVYLSEIGYPERYAGFKFTTRNGEAVTGLVGTRDYCLVLTSDASYILQGYTEDDMTVTLLDNGIGACGHHTNTIVHGTPYITNRHGMFLFNGTWHPVGIGFDKTFSRHFAESRIVPGVPDAPTTEDPLRLTYYNATYYQTGYMLHNPVDKTVQLVLGQSTKGRLGVQFGGSWVVNYETIQPQAGGSFGPGMLSMDSDYNAAGTVVTPLCSAFLVSEDGGSGHMYYGGTFGQLWRDDIYTAFVGTSIITTPTYYFGSVGGYEREGKTLIKFWSHVQAEDTAWKVLVTAGDELVGLGYTNSLGGGIAGVSPHLPASIQERLWGTNYASLQYVDNVPASAETITFTAGTVAEYPTSVSARATPKGTHSHPLPDRVTGRGISFTYVFANPDGVVWRGVGGYIGPGPVTRVAWPIIPMV